MTYDDLFSFEHLYKSSILCKKGVTWKRETQKFLFMNPIYIVNLHNDLLNYKYRMQPLNKFIIDNRGKIREVEAVKFRDRIVEKTIVDYCLKPLIIPTLIYDNGATLKDKGTDFTRARLKQHLRSAYNHYKTNDLYVLKADMHDYFNSIRHEQVIQNLSKFNLDPSILNLIKYIIGFGGHKQGLNIGNQLSQILALQYLNGLDHLIKEKYMIKYYGRYMDDIYLISNNKGLLKDILAFMNKFLYNIGVSLSPNKTQIIGLKNNSFIFMQQKYKLTSSGKIIVKATHSYKQAYCYEGLNNYKKYRKLGG